MMIPKKKTFCKDKLAWDDGGCCCNCTNRLTLLKHPSNKLESKGSVGEETGLYACLAPEIIEGNSQAILFDKEHGYCEMHHPISKKNEQERL